MKSLILAEHDNQKLNAGTSACIHAAKALSENLSILVAGYACESVANEACKLDSVNQVLLAEAPYYAHGQAEEIANLMLDIVHNNTEKYDYILAPASTYGKNILPRLAALLDVSQISEITEILSKDTFVRPTYAGNVLETRRSLDPIKVLTVRSTAFAKAKENIELGRETTKPAPIQIIKPAVELKLSRFLQQEKKESKRPELSSASIVISGGRGLQSKENFQLLENLADKLNAAIGATRAAVDAGFVPNDYQVGQTGKVVAPELYIAIGISGAIQHIAGMKDSKVIVAINKDPEAAILKVSDYYLIGDLFEILPALVKEL